MSQEAEDQRLLPYIRLAEHKGRMIYSAYVPYESENPSIQEIADQTFLISECLSLPTDREDYQPSYSYSFSENHFEIGIAGEELACILAAIENIQNKLAEKGCKVHKRKLSETPVRRY